MEIFSASEIIDKTLIAKKPVTVYKGFPFSKDVYKVYPGQEVGRVYSFIYPSNKSQLFWELTNKKGDLANSYVMHESGAFDMQALKDQGAKSEADKTEAKEDKDVAWYIKKYGTKIGLLIAVIVLGKAAITAYLTRNK